MEEERERYQKKLQRLWWAIFIFSLALTVLGFSLEFLGVLKEEGFLIGLVGTLAVVISLNTQILMKELGHIRDVLTRGQDELRREHSRIIELLRGSKG